MLKRKFGFFRDKKQKSGKYPSKLVLEKKNHIQPISKQKNPDNLIKAIEKKMHLILTLRNEKITSMPYFNSAKKRKNKAIYLLLFPNKYKL